MRIRVLPVLVVALCAGAGAGPASAVLTATVAPSGSITGRSAAAKFTFNTVGRVVSCTSSSLGATLGSASGGAPLTIASNAQWALSGCVASGTPLTVRCGATENVTVDHVTFASLTPGEIGVDCTVSLATVCSIQIVGVVLGTYDNTTSRMTVSTTGQTLVAQNSSNGSGGSCSLLPNDTSVTLSDLAGGSPVISALPLTTITVV